MGVISGSFYSPFPATGELGLSLTSIEGGVAGNGNAASVIAATSTDTSGPFSILSSSHATTSNSPTINALTSGELSTQDHKIIAAIGGTANDSLLVPWNSNGTEPSEISNLKNLGWIKILSLQTAPGSKTPTGANYSLTPVGQAIYKRTVATTLGPGTQATIGNATAGSTTNASAIDANLSSQVSTLVSTLSSVGVNVFA
jgi:hypothetical protein